MKNLLLFALLGAMAWYGYGKLKSWKVPTEAAPAAFQATGDRTPSHAAVERFACDGRTHCSQMRSCAEATYFIQHCPNTKMDGDSDGVPCERQWCN